MVANQIEKQEDIKSFEELNYRNSLEYSDKNNCVFVMFKKERHEQLQFLKTY